MPLDFSPIDGSPMRKVVRYGVELDVCPTSGGIWLDRKELDKIVAMIREEAANAPTNKILSGWGRRTPAVSSVWRRKYANGAVLEIVDNDETPDAERQIKRSRKRGALAEVAKLFDV